MHLFAGAAAFAVVGIADGVALAVGDPGDLARGGVGVGDCP